MRKKNILHSIFAISIEGVNELEEYTGYIGSYTRRKSKGIRKFRFNGTDFELSDLVEIQSPTYLALSDDNSVLYSVVKEGSFAGVASMDPRNPEDMKRAMIENEAPPSHISLFEGGLLACNYHDGKLDLYGVEDGHVTERLQSLQHEGSGPNEGRQEKSHIHFALQNPHNKDVLVCDLGADKVYVYSFDGELTKKGEIIFPAGSGPRHLVFHPEEKIVYVLSELSSQLFTVDFSSGEYALTGTVNALPQDFTGENTAGAIRISNDGKFIYYSNRGHDSLTIFRVRPDSHPEVMENISCEGKHPRDFNLSPDGEYLLLANMETDNLVLYKVDRTLGSLTLVRKDIETPEGVCVVFNH